ncbi:transglutaminase-like domain-containing protein [Bifidobacterium samirii]|uniref:Transglutaminase-like superfamily n=1 Tax=Bifidobacterium samirii TaxID=2306974 RepID=A0A430FV36_9BIFI|nr:transglutaminase-like domain-containing protein [Bifidobacterium samirii]RSX57256.1 Transglutaminase-like superfamily [Bifidobacterium samirii]
MTDPHSGGSLLADDLHDYARRLIGARADLLACAPHAGRTLDALDGDRLTLMRLAYGALPAGDVIDCDPAVLLAYADHALMLRATMPRVRDLPSDAFVHFVFWPRINNERLDDSRLVCHAALRDRTAGLDDARALLETNYWCAEHVTYQPSDGRTLGASGALNRGVGRCGEESTLLVTALRAIGIPARQVYTPRWAHCDDNHAWVEAYVDGRWRFLGACEPEEQLDRGWFDRASTRAMLVHARVFCDYTQGNVDVRASAGDDGTSLLCNLTADYAPVGVLRVRVLRADGTPAAGAHAAAELLNMAEYYPIAVADADDDGVAALTLGRGSVRVHVSDGVSFADAIVDVADADGREIALTLPAAPFSDADAEADAGTDGRWRDVDLKAPSTGVTRSLPLTDDQQRVTVERRAQAEAKRVARVAAFADLVDAATRAALARCYPQAAESGDLDRILTMAGGNLTAVAAFLLGGDGADAPLRMALAAGLRDKDLCDVSAAVLDDALAGAVAVRDEAAAAGVDGRTFADYVLAPRVLDEELRADRVRLRRLLEESGMADALRADPASVLPYVERRVRVTLSGDSCATVISPSGVLSSGVSTETSTRIAFVSVCRALGVPARLHPETGEPEYWADGGFRRAVQAGAAPVPPGGRLTLTAPEGSEPAYWKDWSLGRLHDQPHGVDFLSLDLEDRSWSDGRMELALDEGAYRLVTTVRLPDGGQQACERVFHLHEGDDLTVELRLREPSEEELLESIPVDDVTLTDEDGARLPLSSLLDGRTVLAVLDAHGSEPSIHVLDELAARMRQDGGAAAGIGDAASPAVPILLAACPADAPLSATLSRMIGRVGAPTRVPRCDPATYERLTRGMFVDPDKTPLILTTRRDGDAIVGTYACTGYNVGSVDLALRLASM